MFKYIKAFRIMMKRKDLEERYMWKMVLFAVPGIVIGVLGCGIFKNEVIAIVCGISIMYGLYYGCKAMWIIGKDDRKEFFKELKETANKLK